MIELLCLAVCSYGMPASLLYDRMKRTTQPNSVTDEDRLILLAILWPITTILVLTRKLP